DGIRYPLVTGVQTCALPICPRLGIDAVPEAGGSRRLRPLADRRLRRPAAAHLRPRVRLGPGPRPGLAPAAAGLRLVRRAGPSREIGRASCRERGEVVEVRLW